MEKHLVRNVQDKKIAGVYAGLADYLDILLTSFFGSSCQKLEQKRKLSASL